MNPPSGATAPLVQQALRVTYVPTASLVPYARNPRTHSPQQLHQLTKVVREFGLTNPILVDPDYTIIAGDLRRRVATVLGLAEVPVIVIEGLSEPQKRALRLADNKIALGAGWDEELLRIELLELSQPELEFDLELTGFTTGEIDVRLNDEVDPDDEVIPAVPATPRCRPGDIWQLGEHRIGCGDCRDRDLVSRLLGEGARVGAAFLDPPYNVMINGHANARGRHREFAMASGEMTTAEFRTFLNDCLAVAAQLSAPGAVHFICMDWKHLVDLEAAASPLYDQLLNICVWNKSNAGMGSLYRSKHEMIMVYRVRGGPHRNNVELGRHGRNRTNVWSYASVNSLKGSRRQDLALHPTVKPVGLVADAICDVTRHGDTVLDVFLGSGTTLIAAERTGRRCRGLDIDPAYVDVAIERWCNATGKLPELLHREAEDVDDA